MVDFRVTVFDGSYHDVDSNELSFKLAGSLAFKDAMTRARPTILEPIMNVEVYAPSDFAGDLMGDLNGRRGRIAGMDTRGAMTIIKAQVPMAEMLTYEQHLTSATGGRGSYHMEYSHYDEVPAHLQTKIIAAAKAERAGVEVEEVCVHLPGSGPSLFPPPLLGGGGLAGGRLFAGSPPDWFAWSFSSRGPAQAGPGRAPGPRGALALGRRGVPVGFGLGLRIELAADELHLRDFGAVAAAMAEPQQARVAAGPRREARRDRVEQLGHDLAVLQVLHDQPPRVQRLAVRVAAGHAALGDRDEPLDERPQLLRLRHGRRRCARDEAGPSPGSAASRCDAR